LNVHGVLEAPSRRSMSTQAACLLKAQTTSNACRQGRAATRIDHVSLHFDKQHPGDYQFSRVPFADMMFIHVKAVQADQVVIVELDSHLHGDRPFQVTARPEQRLRRL
jgi:hypothetical protein